MATKFSSLVVVRNEALGLWVALDKTEVLLFDKPRCGPPPGASIEVSSILIPVRAQVKYLCLILDGRWLFFSRKIWRRKCSSPKFIDEWLNSRWSTAFALHPKIYASGVKTLVEPR